MSAPSVFEVANRTRKVAAILAVLAECGITADEVRGIGEDGWKQLAHDAGVNLPSAETRRLVIERLDAIEADQKAESAWEDAQMCETGADRCPPRE